MKKIILFSVFLVFFSTRILSQYPDLSTYTITNAGTTVFEEGNDTHTEVPPWMITVPGGPKQYFLTDGTNGFVCWTSLAIDFITSSFISVSIPDVSPVGVTVPQIHDVGGCPTAIPVQSSPVFDAPTAGINKGTVSVTLNPGFSTDLTSGPFYAEIVNGLAAGQDWRRDYYGVYTAQYYTDPVNGPVTLSFQHAENRMACINGNYCYGSVSPVLASYLVTDPLACNYLPIYAGFLCASWIPNNTSTQNGEQLFNDLGPISWPCTGYLLPSGQKASLGLTVPSSIIYNGYVYVYYVESSPYTAPGDPTIPLEEGRIGGIKVVRAPVSNALDPHAYQVYYKDPNGNVSWNPALPPGFDKNNIDAFWNVPGPKSTDVMGDSLINGGTTPTVLEARLSVAQVRNTNYFIAINSYYDETLPSGSPNFKKALRFSTDLVNWSPRTVIETVSDWTQTLYNYPILMGSDGLSNNLVDSNDFYILGTGSTITSTTNKLHVYLPPANTSVVSGVKSLSANSISITPDSSTTANKKVLAGPAGILPNPNHGVFQLGYTLNGSAAIQVNVFDVTGRLILEGSPVDRQAGYYQENIDISSRTPGVYLVELLVNGSKSVYKALYDL